MKHIIFLILTLNLTILHSQEIVSDSSYLKWDKAWFRVVTQTYDNGNINILQTYIGDTMTLYNQSIDGIRNSTSSMANDVSFVSNYGKKVRDLLKDSDEILAKAGKSPVDSIELADIESFLISGWTIKSPTGTTDITFNRSNADKLRYQHLSTTNRQVDLLGSVIRLRNYPTNGTTTDFYKSPNSKRWYSLSREYILISPRNTANK